MPWTSEVASIGLSWLVFFAASYAISKKEHIKIEIFLKYFPYSIKKGVLIFTDVVILIFAFLMLVHGYNYVWVILPATTSALVISQAIFYIPVPIASVIMIFYLVLDLKDILLDKEK